MSDETEIGFVQSIRNFLIDVDGLPNVKINDLVESQAGLRGWVNSLSHDQVQILMVDEGKITPGEMFKKLPARLSINTGDFLLGRSINPLGVPIDGKGLLERIKQANFLELDAIAPGIQTRQFINTQFHTGITLIDTLIPLGKGQRELVMGDAHSGKTGFLIDLMVNQARFNQKLAPGQKKTICIYASIGKPGASVRSLIDVLKANKALDSSVIIAASSSEPTPLIFLTPKTAFTIAEYFQKKGHDVLLILDDLGTHAKIYREMSLLSFKSPGREAYPGDIFYQHAHLLERAGSFKPGFGGGSITALPVIELDLNDFTTLIPTSLMSMTDGHLLFKSSLRNQGQQPAIDIFLSVSRVGRQTQQRLTNLVAGRIRNTLTLAEELQTVSSFSAELPPQTQHILKQKRLIDEILKQDPITSIPEQVQIILLALVYTSFLTDKDRYFLEKYKNPLINAFESDADLLKITRGLSSIKNDQQLVNLLETQLKKLNELCPS
ncbi:hypothetical protein HYW42_03225 [Candidatus Daviesbacteria bacterium]|nr:hypothetical protein [Candidatus Daviesbacteria bacterium]